MEAASTAPHLFAWARLLLSCTKRKRKLDYVILDVIYPELEHYVKHLHRVILYIKHLYHRFYHKGSLLRFTSGTNKL